VLYRLHFRCTVSSVPVRILDRARARFREISHTLAAVSSSSSFWSSLTENPLYVDVAGWRFKYTIDRERKEFDVLEIIRVSDVLPAASRAIG
jgi:hypothetical protein